MNTNTDMNLDDLLDISLDDIADLPEFKVFPAGAHRCTMALEKKEINKHPAWELKLVAIETVELADPAEVPLEQGTESSVAFMMDNEFGAGNLKRVITPIAQHFGVSKLGELAEASKGAEVLAVTKTRQNKEKSQTYLEIVSLQVL